MTWNLQLQQQQEVSRNNEKHYAVWVALLTVNIKLWIFLLKKRRKKHFAHSLYCTARGQL